MIYKISKELFEAVIGLYKNEVAEMYISGENIFWHTYKNEFTRNKNSEINIDTFFFKCKEWALRQGGLTILSGTYKNTVTGFLQNKAYIGYAAIQYYVIDEYRTGTYCLKTYDRIKASCERQAVFDICQRILDNKDKQ